MPHSAVFADTHAESPAVYSWLDRLEKLLAFPVVRVSTGNLMTEALRVKTSTRSGKNWMERTLPVFYENAGKRGMAQRRCTFHFKIKPIRRYQHKFIHKGVISWIGISTDEAGRMRDSDAGYIENRYPLIEKGMSRTDCIAWLQSHGYPEPPKSSCIFCPFKSDRQWIDLRDNEQLSFEIAVEFERRLQATQIQHEENPYIGFFHKTLVTLDKVAFQDRSQKSGFMNDCSGTCGV